MNYYKKIAEMLGFELGEEFSVKNCKTKELNRPRYKITQEEGIMYSIDREKWCRSVLLMSIINGSYSIVKIPWKPKKGEAYWHYSKGWEQATFWKWKGDYIDLMLWKVGNCFKTKEEAETKGKEIMEQIMKEYKEK